MFQKGEELARKLGAKRYLECSALTQEGLARVFEEAVKVILFPQKEEEAATNDKAKTKSKDKKEKDKDSKEKDKKDCVIQ